MKTVFLLVLVSLTILPEKKSTDKLVQAYPLTIDHIKDNYVFFKDGGKLIYDDEMVKGTAALLENPDIEDQFYYTYTRIRTN